jgi:prepilin-type N-terminal cleavage/methylation domain-containing protein
MISLRSPGFTLIELLVVVTIIIVLLALLTPALDRAMYQAELTLCGSQLKAFATGLTTGATERNRKYPTRLTRFQPIDVSQMDLTSRAVLDERPELRAYLGLELNRLLNCPLSRPVDIDRSEPDAIAQTSYAMWHGWPTGGSESAMRKLGDRWTYMGQRFAILANDYELGNDATYYSGQPDRDGVLTPYVVNNAGAIVGWDKQTTSTWYAPLQTIRGRVDMNVVYTDNSVSRIESVQHFQKDDERLTFVPNTWNAGSHINNWQRVPTH